MILDVTPRFHHISMIERAGGSEYIRFGGRATSHLHPKEN
jgi:hypothetical protein